MSEFALNIEEYSIGGTIVDLDGSDCTITNKTLNSIEVFIEKKTDRGVSHTNWFDMKAFNKRFLKNNTMPKNC